MFRRLCSVLALATALLIGTPSSMSVAQTRTAVTFMGAWSSSNAPYAVNDQVTFSGGLYNSLVAVNTASPVANTTTANWQFIASTTSGSTPTFTVGSVTSLSTGATPTATIAGTSPNYTLSLGIPTGSPGLAGAPGTTPTFTVGTVTALTAGATPTVTIGGSAPGYVLNFGIPAGANGTGASISPPAAWATGSTYAQSALVTYSGVVWQAQSAVPASTTPFYGSSYWSAFALAAGSGTVNAAEDLTYVGTAPPPPVAGANGITQAVAPTSNFRVGLPAAPIAGLLKGTVVSTPVTFTGTETSGSTTIASVSSIANLVAGQPITGPNIPTGTTIASITPTTVTLSNAPTASGTGVTLTVPNVVDQLVPAVAGTDYFSPQITSVGSFASGQLVTYLSSVVTGAAAYCDLAHGYFQSITVGAYFGNCGPTVGSGVAISAAFLGSAYSGDPATEAVAGSAFANATANGVKAMGMNPSAQDTGGLTSGVTLTAEEPDITLLSPVTAYSYAQGMNPTIHSIGGFLGTPPGAAVRVSSGTSGVYWGNGLLIDPGAIAATTPAVNVGATCTAASSSTNCGSPFLEQAFVNYWNGTASVLANFRRQAAVSAGTNPTNFRYLMTAAGAPTGATYFYDWSSIGIEGDNGGPITWSMTPQGALALVSVSPSTPVAPTSGGTGSSMVPTSGQIPLGNVGGTFTPASMSGDCSLGATGAVTCTKTNGTPFGTAATTPSSAYDPAGAATTAAAAAQTAAQAASVPVSTLGAANGTAQLDNNGRLNPSQATFQIQTSGLLGEYIIANVPGCTGTTLLDSSGNGNTLTLPTGAGAPVLALDTNGICSLQFPTGTSLSTALPLQTPFASPVTMQVVATMPLNSSNYQTLFGYSALSGTLEFNMTGQTAFGSPEYYLGCAAGTVCASYLSPGTGYDVYTMQAGASATGQFWRNTTQALWISNNPSFVNSGTGHLIIGGSSDYGCTANNCFAHGVKMYAITVYSSALGQTGVNQNFTAFTSLFAPKGLPIGVSGTIPLYSTAITNHVHHGGNSQDQGYGAGTAAANLMGLPAANWQISIGSLYNSTLTGHALSGEDLALQQFNPNAYNFAVTGTHPTNDFCSGTNYNNVGLPALEGELARLITTLKGYGYQQILVPDMVSRTGNTHSPYTGTCDAAKNTWNTWLRQNIGNFGSNVSLLDLAEWPGLGADGAYANPTTGCNGSNCFYSDNVHFTLAGEQVYANIEKNLLLSLTGFSEASPDQQSGTTYTMTAQDNFITAGVTAAATWTLPDGSGLTGRRFKIYNPTAYAITVAANTASAGGTITAPTISGNATISAGTNAIYQVQLSAASTGGYYWLRTQ